MDTQLCDTPLTGRQLEQLLINSKKLPVNNIRLKSVDASMPAGCQGYMSKVLRIDLNWSDPNADLPKSIIVKVIGSARLDDVIPNVANENSDEMMSLLFRQGHNVECKVYDLHGLNSVVPMVRCYASQHMSDDQSGIIILEDMTDRGQTLPYKFIGLGYTPGQLDNLLQTLANLHAWSVNNIDWRKTIPPLKELNAIQLTQERMMAALPTTMEKYPDTFKDVNVDKLKEYMNNEKFLEIFGSDPRARYKLPLVLVHGDVQYMNTLFERGPDQEVTDKLLAMLDWQLSHQGCALEDLSKILVICWSVKIDRCDVENMLKRYVQLYNNKVENPENRVTFEDCQQAFDEMFVFVGLMLASGFTLITSLVENMEMSADEKSAVNDRVVAYYSNIVKEAVKMVKW